MKNRKKLPKCSKCQDKGEVISGPDPEMPELGTIIDNCDCPVGQAKEREWQELLPHILEQWER